MASYSRALLSGSTSGRPIPVAATATPGTIIHTAQAGAAAFDEVYLWVSNVSAAAATLTLQWGGVGDPADHLVKGYSIPANSGPVPVAVGQTLNGGLAVRAFASVAGSLNISGFANLIT